MLTSVAFLGCHKEVIDMTNLGLMRLKVSRGNTSGMHTKGLWESFSALISVNYESGESVSYQGILSDPDGDGFYSNTFDEEGEKLYIQQGKKFKVIIIAVVDGETASGESDWLIFEGNEGKVLDIEIKLLAGKNRIGIYPPRVAGDKVVATGEIVELVPNSNSQQPNEISECGFICMPYGAYNTLTSEDDFTLEYQGDQSQWRTEYDYSMLESGGKSFTVLFEDLYPTTQYYIRGFAFLDTTVLYSRVLNFTTEEKDTAELQIMFTDSVRNADDLLSVTGLVNMNVYAPIADITEVGMCILPLSSNAEFNPNEQVENQIVVQGRVEEEQGVFGRGIVYTDFDMTQLEECVDYKFILYAKYNDKVFFDHDYLTFGRTFDPQVYVRCEPVEILPIANTNGKAQLKAVVTGSSCSLDAVTEVGFEYKISFTDVSNDQLVETRQSFPFTLDDTVFSIEVPVPAAEVNIYYRSYYVRDGEYYYDNEMPNTYLLEPEIRPEFANNQIETSNPTPFTVDVSYTVNTNGLTCECGVMYYKVETMQDNPVFDVSRSDIRQTSVGQASGQLDFELRNLTMNSDYIVCPYVVNEGLTIPFSQITNYASTIGQGDEILQGASETQRYVIFYCGADYSLAYIEPLSEGGDVADNSIYQELVWGEMLNVSMLSTPQPADGVVDGTFNTNSIIQAYGTPSPDSIYAAWSCNSNTITCEQGTFRTYLPSSSELQKLLDYLSSQPQNELTTAIMRSAGIWTSDQVSATQATAFVNQNQNASSLNDFQQQAANKNFYYLTIPIFRY